MGVRFRPVLPGATRGLLLRGLEDLLAVFRLEIFVEAEELRGLVKRSFLILFKSDGPNLPMLNPSAPAATTQIVGAISDNKLTKMTILGVIGFALV